MMEEESGNDPRTSEIRERMLQKQQEEEQRARVERQVQSMVASILTPEASTRLTNIRLVDHEKYLRVAQTILGFAKQNNLKEKITDEQLKTILQKVTPRKREITIKRK